MTTEIPEHGLDGTALSMEDYDAMLFDLDGVVTDTASLHALAWKILFDEYLARRAAPDGKSWAPFDADRDYKTYVDGKPRYEGVDSFLRSRDIGCPYGTPDDDGDAETVCGLGNRKNALFNELLHRDGARPIPSSVRFIKAVRSLGLKTAVVSSSRNCGAILEAAGLVALFDAKVDGVYAAEFKLKGKPNPDTFLEAARLLGVDPSRAVVFEDAIAGVQAGRNGKFGLVVGVDRGGHGDELRENGADVVVTKLTDINVGNAQPVERLIDELPCAMHHMAELVDAAGDRRLAFFFDYDGTLTPIVARPDMALLSDAMRATLKALARRHFVAVISGRDLQDVQGLVGIENIFYAGSHGFRISGPGQWQKVSEHGTEFLPILDRAEQALRERTEEISGAIVERKHLSVAVHYRLVEEDGVAKLAAIVDDVLRAHPELRQSAGKKVFDLQPDIDWNKGKAILWMLEALNLDRHDVLPIYIGDDVTDEDAFRALRNRGLGIVVKGAHRTTGAQYALDDPDQVCQFLAALISAYESTANG
ncbi:MAG: trehalose-phosphatase [Alphaproteobacteria bacterium]